jgi:hypothetical protein
LEHFGLGTLRDLPDLEALEDAGLLNATADGEQAEWLLFRVADVDISSAE